MLIGLPLVLGALACVGPTADPPPDSPAAQATYVRRTAVAEVQRIIANNATPTSPPAATATPSPSCPNAIWWTDARSHVGETRVVEGTIVGTRAAPFGTSLVEIGQPYPDPTGLAVALPASAQPAADLSGKMVCVNGRITLVEGRPTLQVDDAAAILVVN